MSEVYTCRLNKDTQTGNCNSSFGCYIHRKFSSNNPQFYFYEQGCIKSSGKVLTCNGLYKPWELKCCFSNLCNTEEVLEAIPNASQLNDDYPETETETEDQIFISTQPPINNYSDTKIESKHQIKSQNVNRGTNLVSILVPTFVLVLTVVILTIFFIYKNYKKKFIKQSEYKDSRRRFLSSSTATNDTSATQLSEERTNQLSQYLTATVTTGSGGLELVQRTISRDIRIDYDMKIGYGRFGNVFKGNWNMEDVAVKIFFSMHESSWSRETEIYQTCMLRHDNILGYIASDIKGIGTSVLMLLITEYHPIGSLYDYLQTNTIDYNLLKKFSYSIINGLNHLHTEIIGSKYKPIIGHRDLKSRNILVKSTFDCCIADFGLAVRYNSLKQCLDIPSNKLREGTVRIMAPEVLNQTLDFNQIDDFKRADVYAYGLVLWELIRRYKSNNQNGFVEEYCPPYGEYTSTEPTIEDMKVIVCDKQLRPTINEWKKPDENLSELITLMEECWQSEPLNRVETLRIKKNLNYFFNKT